MHFHYLDRRASEQKKKKKKNRQDNRKLRLNIRPSILIWVLRNGRKNNSAQRNGIDVKLSKERKKINKSQALTICNTSNNLTLSSCLPTFRAPAIVGVEEEEEKKNQLFLWQSVSFRYTATELSVSHLGGW